MGATCAIWGPYGGHMGAICTVQEPDGTIWEANGATWGSHAVHGHCVHYGMERAPYGSCVQAMGAAFSGLHHNGATCAVWEPHTPYGSRYDICEEDGIIWGKNVTYGGHLEAECAGWELCVPYWR
jgi:hypothetical protein